MNIQNLIVFIVASLLIVSCAPVDGDGFFGPDTVSKEDRSAWVSSQRSTDPSICAGITTSNNFHDGCYENVAINTKDVSLCEKIHGNVDFCKSDYAKETGDFSVCGTLSEENTRSNCYARIGKETYNAALCAKVERVSTRDECYMSVSYGSDDPAICDAIEEDSDGRDACYSSVALQLQDPSYCRKMEGDDYFRDNCLYKVAVAKADFDFCETLKGDDRNRCVDGVYDTCRSLYSKDPTNLPYYCQPGVMSPSGVPMTYG